MFWSIVRGKEVLTYGYVNNIVKHSFTFWKMWFDALYDIFRYVGLQAPRNSIIWKHPLGLIQSVKSCHCSNNVYVCTGLASSISCSHSRSKELFIESINSDCRFYGHKCPSSDSFENGQCLGCPTGGCPVMGYDADQTKTITGVFFLSTSGSSPYCGR